MEERRRGDYGDSPELTILFWILATLFAPPLLWWLIENDVFAIF